MNKTARRRALANLFHACMAILLDPIISCGETGIAMMSADMVWRRCHPIFAVFVGDYPEQALVTCTYNGRCPKCQVPCDRLGEFQEHSPRIPSDAINTYQLADKDAHAFHRACRNTGLKPVYHPFWQPLPFADIFTSITPDILHQLLQGVMKHVVAWITSPTVFGSRVINARCRSLPPNHDTTIFTKGITSLSRVSGQEHKNMCRIILGLIVDLPLPGGRVSSRVVKAVRALLDFLYLAQYESHTMETLQRLHESLARFHENKMVFIDLGTRKHFNIPKLHALIHYASAILLFGTADNYNTEQTERLHIDFAKKAYRATNLKNEYLQMTTWLSRHEKVQQHAAFIKRQEQGERLQSEPIGPPQAHNGHIRITLHPTHKAVSFEVLAEKYGAVHFQDLLAEFIAQVNYPADSARNQRARADDTLLPFRAVPVFHKLRFMSSLDSNDQDTVDAVHVRPEQTDSHGQVTPSRFDTVLVQNGILGRIAQVRAVFQIPSKVFDVVFPSLDVSPPSHLAYVQWFSPIPTTPDPVHQMYKVSRLTQNDPRHAGIVPVESILCSVHLFPQFGPSTQDWDSFTVLERCQTFYINPFASKHSYFTFT